MTNYQEWRRPLQLHLMLTKSTLTLWSLLINYAYFVIYTFKSFNHSSNFLFQFKIKIFIIFINLNNVFLEASFQRHQYGYHLQRASRSQTPLMSNPIMLLCVYERKRVMGLLLLCGIRCALFVCFVSLGEAGPSQNVGSVSGSVRISGSHDTHNIWVSDMANFPLNSFCVRLCVLLFALVDI